MLKVFPIRELRWESWQRSLVLKTILSYNIFFPLVVSVSIKSWGLSSFALHLCCCRLYKSPYMQLNKLHRIWEYKAQRDLIPKSYNFICVGSQSGHQTEFHCSHRESGMHQFRNSGFLSYGTLFMGWHHIFILPSRLNYLEMHDSVFSSQNWTCML